MTTGAGVEQTDWDSVTALFRVKRREPTNSSLTGSKAHSMGAGGEPCLVLNSGSGSLEKNLLQLFC